MQTKKLRRRCAPIVTLLLGAPLLAGPSCGKTAVTVAGSGGNGSTATGGSLGQGGVVGLGGTTGQGGVVGLGGTTGAGGIGLGGATGQGGVIGPDGAAGAGGQGGSSVTPTTPVVHRPQALSCVGVHAPGEPDNPQYGQCTKHADCTAGANGRCIHGIGSASTHYYCVYDQCATDSDCDAGKTCYCTPSDAARCLSVGNCRTDADCGGGSHSYCSPSNGWDCGGVHSTDSYYCHTPNDTCIDNSDCTGRDYCNYDAADGRWKCVTPNMNCVIG